MENRPPFPASPLIRPSSLMHPFPSSKSSPLKRDANRILAPQHNHAVPPSHDVFNTGLLTPQGSQNTVGSDAAKSLISPPPEDSASAGPSRQSSSWTRGGSEPASTLRHASNTGSASKRKRSVFPSVPPREDGSLHQLQRMEEASPNPKSRKQTRRARVESDVEGDVGCSSHPFPENTSPIARKQRQSHAPPPEAFESDRLRRSRTPSVSPTKARHSPALLCSPHATNNKADYIPPVISHTRQHLSLRARSSTPVAPYEPPAERFTPPREVFRSSPRVSKSSKRKKVLKITIKKEPPEIDLSCLPPPSPTDDPLLLHGRQPCPRSPVPTNARQTPLLESTPPGKQLSPLNRCALDFPLPGIPSDVDDNEDTELLEQPVFNFAANDDESWSSSDSGSPEQEGEYTGKFRDLHVLTKVDPPTSATRERIEQWGRPISPFPRKGSPIPEIVEENDDDEASDLDLSLEQPQFHLEGNEDCHVPEALEDVQEDAQEHEIEVQQEQIEATEISMTEPVVPSKDIAHDNHAATPSHVEDTLLDQEHNDETHESFEESPSYPQEGAGVHIEHGDELMGQNGNSLAQERDEVIAEFHPVAAQQENPVSTEIFDIRIDSDDESELIGEEQADEEIVVRTLSDDPLPVTSPQQCSSESRVLEERIEVDEPMVESLDEEPEGDSSDESDLSVVKIVSDDPWAAARAAAILKQHDWDLVMKETARKNRRSSTVESLIRKARRADVTSAGVSKSSSPARSARRSFGVVIDGRVVMAGSPSMTLPELLHEAQSDLDSSTLSRRASPAFRTPSPAPSTFKRPEAPLVIDTDGPREWSRSDWKLLDACFTDVRLEIGARWGGEGVMGDVDAVDLEDVVQRFEDIFGGAEVVAGLGPAFERKDMLKRAKALQKKQRAGEGAPPTPTLRFSSVSSTPTVPDFTPVHPARRQGISSTLPMLAAPVFQAQTTPQLPASLMGPRYSHLLEEARSLSKQDGSEPSTPSEPFTFAASDDDDKLTTGATSHLTPDYSVKGGVPRTPSMGTRMKGFFFSYLPTLKKKTPVQKAHEPARPGLPLPPPEVLEKPRGPVLTPQPRLAPRPAHPKELVNLQHAPAPTRIPALPRLPKRLVDLRPVSPLPVASDPVEIPEERRNSGGSVKDLVSSFEEMDRSREIEARALELRRQKSAGRLAANVKTTTSTMNGKRPVWK